MSILPTAALKLEADDLTAMKSYVTNSCRRKVKTDPHASQNLSPYSERHAIPLTNQHSELSSIFTKRKRASYSGYKQCTIAKSKLIDFKPEQQPQETRKPTRSFEANMKNIAKLRRRFSCQPSMISLEAREESSTKKCSVENE
jgi:hypothetical protein